MARVAVVGAGVGGLGAALALSREGHDITLVERDATPAPADAHEAFAWDRRGAPQVRHSHALLARLRNLLRDRFPDVLADLLAVGVTEIRFMEMMPAGIADRSPRAGDEDLVALAGRRTTFEWVLRRAALADGRVRLIDGVGVDGLTFAATGSATPAVTGVRCSGRTDLEVLDADLVVVANGSRSNLPAWLAEGGVHLPEKSHDTGIVYYSRFYRLTDGAEAPSQEGPVAGDLGYLKFGVFPGDDRTYSITLAARSDDAEVRSMLLDPAVFDTAAAAIPATAPWAAPTLAEPITEVHVMARLVNRRRDFLTDDGDPRVMGLHAVGDAHTCTNPLYGRGCSLAMVQATLLAEAVAAHADDPLALALAYEQASAREILPWYRAAVAQDRASQAEADRAVGGAARPAAADEDPLRALIRDGLVPAIRIDPEVYRAFLRMFNLLAPPDALVADADLMTRVVAVYQGRDERGAEPSPGPDRSALLAAVQAAA